MAVYGLIGFPLSHSFSQKYFTGKFAKENIADAVYKLFPIENIAGFPELMNSEPDLAGLNVTLPYKVQITDYLDKIDTSARQIGAVNVIKILKKNNNSVLAGYNTDGYGFSKSLLPLLKPHHTQALILGTGGAAKAVAFVLHNLKIPVLFASRNPENTGSIRYEDISKKIIDNTTLIVNASPIGMFPDIKSCPQIPYQYITPKHLLFDLVYNPQETRFMQEGKKRGATVTNGLAMLHLQAEKAWEIWNEPYVEL